jgi:hypothetical protein
MIELFVVMGLFMFDNNEALTAFKQKQDEGYTWEYVGRQQRDPDALAIPIIREDTGEEIVYWRLTK